MKTPRFVALPTESVHALQAGARDANGQVPEHRISNGAGVPCRHCLTQVARGEPDEDAGQPGERAFALQTQVDFVDDQRFGHQNSLPGR